MPSDPFVTAFGDDDDENDTSGTWLDETAAARVDNEADTTQQRTAENGVLSFHNGTEQSLLLYVQQAVNKHRTVNSDPQHHSNSQIVLQTIDEFCFKRHWMMHVGPDKGCIVQDFLKDHIMQHGRKYSEQTYNVVELGTYCGYSTIRIADTLLQHNHIVPKFHIHTIDINSQSQNIAKQLIALAGLEQYVSFIVREPSKNDHQPYVLFTQQLLNSILRQTINYTKEIPNANVGSIDKRIDFLFVDHAKEMYLSDLQLMESCGFIQQGTAVAADNVVFFQLSDYCAYMATLQTKKIVRTELVTNNIYLEYAPTLPDNELRDGLELTIYLEDPIWSSKTTAKR